MSEEHIPDDVVDRSLTLSTLRQTTGRTGHLPFSRAAIENWKSSTVPSDLRSMFGARARKPDAVVANLQVLSHSSLHKPRQVCRLPALTSCPRPGQVVCLDVSCTSN
jgi:hypothetical protein